MAAWPYLMATTEPLTSRRRKRNLERIVISSRDERVEVSRGGTANGDSAADDAILLENEACWRSPCVGGFLE